MNLYSLLVLLLALFFLSSSASAQTVGDCAQNVANGVSANAVLGQTSFSSAATSTALNGLLAPSSVAVDPLTGSVFVSDSGHDRVLRFPSGATTADIYFGNPSNPNVTTSTLSPAGIDFDSNGNLYVVDQGANRVLVFLAAGSASVNSKAADVIIGQTTGTSNLPGSGATQFNFPEGLYIDRTRANRIIVADAGNGRVVYFDGFTPSAATPFPNPSATGLIGQTSFGPKPTVVASATSLSSPFGVTVDSAGNLWVSDFAFNRVTRYPLASYTGAPGTATADNVLGQNGFTATVATNPAVNLNQPFGISVDTAVDTLYVADSANNRVVAYVSVNGATFSNPASDRSPTVVFGQSSLTANTAGTTANTLKTPNGVYYWLSQNAVMVSDTGNNRVIRYCGQIPPTPAASPSQVIPSGTGTHAGLASATRSKQGQVSVNPVSSVSVSRNNNLVDLCVRNGKGKTVRDRKFSNICTGVFTGTVSTIQQSIVRRNGKSGVKNFLCCASVPKNVLTAFSFSWKGKVKTFRKLGKLCQKANGVVSSSTNSRTGVVHYRCSYP